MYREESISSAFSSVNGRSRGAVERNVRVNGTTLREKIRTKNGKITKAKVQMRKTASALSPEVLYFFRNEMQKEAILTPASAYKAMTYARPGLFGDMVRKAGRFGGHLQAKAWNASYKMNRMSNSVNKAFDDALDQANEMHNRLAGGSTALAAPRPPGKITRMVQNKAPDLYEALSEAKNRAKPAILREMYLGARPAAEAAQKALLVAPVLGPNAALTGLGTDAALHMVRRTGIFPRLTNAASMVNNANEAFSVGEQLVNMARPFV
jgi:hypothetical protein